MAMFNFDFTEQQKQEAALQAQQTQEPDVDFTFEKGGLKVKGKLKDLPRLSQDPVLAPYLNGIGQSISQEQAVDSEEQMARLEEINKKVSENRKKYIQNEIEIAGGDKRYGFMNLFSRDQLRKNLDLENSKLGELKAELSFNRQAGRADPLVTPEEQPAQPAAPAPSPVVQQSQPASFASESDARAAGAKAGDVIILQGVGRVRLK